MTESKITITIHIRNWPGHKSDTGVQVLCWYTTPPSPYFKSWTLSLFDRKKLKSIDLRFDPSSLLCIIGIRLLTLTRNLSNVSPDKGVVLCQQNRGREFRYRDKADNSKNWPGQNVGVVLSPVFEVLWRNSYRQELAWPETWCRSINNDQQQSTKIFQQQENWPGQELDVGVVLCPSLQCLRCSAEITKSNSVQK